MQVEISDFEMVNLESSESSDNLEQGLIGLFDEIVEKGNQTSKFKRKFRKFERFANQVCVDCLESLFRCYHFGQNEVSHFVNEFKEKYSEQLNGNTDSDIEMGIIRNDDMQRS